LQKGIQGFVFMVNRALSFEKQNPQIYGADDAAGRFRLIQPKVRSTIHRFWQHSEAIEIRTLDGFALPATAAAVIEASSGSDAQH
jgi:hypothetical protein